MSSKQVWHLRNPKTLLPLCERGGIDPLWTVNVNNVTCKFCLKKIAIKVINSEAIIYEDRSGSIDATELNEFLSELRKL